MNQWCMITREWKKECGKFVEKLKREWDSYISTILKYAGIITSINLDFLKSVFE